MREISFSIATVAALLLFALGPAIAETPQATCDRLAGDAVPIEQVDAAAAALACAAAAKAAPGTPRVEYEYGRTLEKSGSIDQAKEMYQWASDDGFSPATAALARINAQPPSQAPTESARRQQMASRLDALAEIAQRTANSAPRDHDDPVAILAITGTDSSAILKWVQTNTHLISYAGMLRGASGVLMDRAGNSLDRSLLLADLLHRAGYEVRIARAQLDPPAAHALFARLQTLIPKPAPSALLDRAALLKQIGTDPRLDPKVVEQAVAQTIDSQRRFSASVKDLYGKVYPAVMQTLGSDPKRDQQLASDAEAVLRDHFWVQRRTGNGWEDLDPDADVLHKLAATSTFAPDQVPDELKHRVTLRVILETWTGGKLSESKLMERTWVPSELTGKSITLTHMLLPQDAVDQIAQQQDPQSKFVDGLTKAWVVEPMLQVGDETIIDRLYTLGGQVLPAGNATLRQLGVVNGLANFGKLKSGLDQAFGNGQSDQTQPPDEATAPTKVTAEWIEFEIDTPGRPAQRRRRAVFDLLGPADRVGDVQKAPNIDAAAKERRALLLAGQTDVLIVGATPAPEWLRRVGNEGMAAMAAQSAAAERSSASISALAQIKPLKRIEFALWGWAVGRGASAILPAGAPVEPNVALLWHTPVRSGAGKPDFQLEFDIVTNQASPGSDFSSNVAQGVLDTVVEHVMLGESDDGGDNAAALTGMDASAGRHWLRLDPGNPASAEKLAIAPEARARIKSELANGNIVLAPNEPTQTSAGARIAWWRVDPRTGATVGIGEDGRGSELSEEAMLGNALVGTAICSFLGIGERLAGTNKHASVAAAKWMACVAAAGMSAPHGIVVIVAEGYLEAVVFLFELAAEHE